jgi:hypothetical protein
MTQLTLRGFDKELERKLREEARRRGMSLNRAALSLMRRGAGLEDESPRPNVVGGALDYLAGTWSEAEAEELQRTLNSFEDVDEELWS